MKISLLQGVKSMQGGYIIIETTIGRNLLMYIGSSLFLLALGAIFTFAIRDALNGVDLGTIGIILMIVGVIGLLLSLFLNSREGRGRGDAVAGDRVVERPAERERVVER